MEAKRIALPFDPGGDGDEETFLRVLDAAIGAVQDAEIPYLLMGGVASATYARPRWTHDIDLFVQPRHARSALAALSDRGFTVEETDPVWLYKAWHEGCLVDVIFRSRGDIYLDDEMMERAMLSGVAGRMVKVIPAEDLLVIKALCNAEEVSRHWYDALSLLATCDLDWDYLVRRARRGLRRVLSLMLYAQSSDIFVPDRVVARLWEMASAS